MNKEKDKILIIGGYGAVGSFLSVRLSNEYPDKVIVAGRSFEKSKQFIRENSLAAIPAMIDIVKFQFENFDFESVHTAISCVETQKDEKFLMMCIKNQVNYTELATSFESYNRLMEFEGLVKVKGITWIPGVGLMPGISGVFAQQASLISNEKLTNVQSYVLLGLGESHGLDAIRWMLDSSGDNFKILSNGKAKEVKPFSNSKHIRLLDETKPRKFYRFNFGDQHIIQQILNVNQVATRLAFDSRWITSLIGSFSKIGLLKVVSQINPKWVFQFLSKVKFGSERFAVQTNCTTSSNQEFIFELIGEGEARATAIITQHAVHVLYSQNSKKGFLHFEESIDFEDFKTYLEKNDISIKTNLPITNKIQNGTFTP